MPRGFRFPLQPVLDQRQRAEDACMLEAAALERERLAVETKLKDLQARITGAKIDLRGRLQLDPAAQNHGRSAVVDITDVRLQANASLHLTAQAQRVALELAGAYRRLEAARSRLMQARTARKAVDLLKERRLSEWKSEQARQEFARLDEILTSRSGKTGDQP